MILTEELLKKCNYTKESILLLKYLDVLGYNLNDLIQNEFDSVLHRMVEVMPVVALNDAYIHRLPVSEDCISKSSKDLYVSWTTCAGDVITNLYKNDGRLARMLCKSVDERPWITTFKYPNVGNNVFTRCNKYYEMDYRKLEMDDKPHANGAIYQIKFTDLCAEYSGQCRTDFVRSTHNVLSEIGLGLDVESGKFCNAAVFYKDKLHIKFTKLTESGRYLEIAALSRSQDNPNQLEFYNFIEDETYVFTYPKKLNTLKLV